MATFVTRRCQITAEQLTTLSEENERLVREEKLLAEADLPYEAAFSLSTSFRLTKQLQPLLLVTLK